MRYASWLLSLCLHLIVLATLAQTVRLAPLDPEKLMELDLTRLEPSEEVVIAPPAPPAPPPEPMECPPLPEAPPVPPEAAPLPMDKTLVLADEPVAPLPEPEPEPEPGEPEVKEISPVKTPEPERPDPDKGERIDVRKGDIVVHRGHEARFGRSMMADYFSYSASEFSGQFTTRDNRTVTIIDARNTKYGRFLIYDSKNKTLRRLKEFSKYVYTIGPSLDADEPVIGVVTFLAKDDRIERFVLTTDDDRFAHYPLKVHVREDEVAFDAPAGRLAGLTTLPPEGEGHPGVVFLPGQCVDPGLIRGVTRALAASQLASLFFEVRGCEGEDDEPADRATLAEDARAGLKLLSDTPRLRGGMIGLWGNGPGAPLAVDAVGAGFARPDFLVCLLNDGVSPADMPGMARLRALDMPVLWLITGRKTSAWRPFITTLESLRDKAGRAFTIVVAPQSGSREIAGAEGDLSAWMDQVAEEHARLAASWIRSLER
ncbi:MAG: hypothetical protein V3571_12895 [Pseudodesulfovibrio sp.]